ncbi:MAG: TlyA family RNA methyltransferase [Chloroflexi bacterium]|nr:TlyA family RNA methyltransferase [Chloroflexota bacterium]
MPRKLRLDLLLVEHGLADSRSLAQRLVMAGQVRVDGQVVIKPATKVASNAEIAVDHGPRFVSRGGEKLDAALEAFPVDVTGRICADAGASTGGFTDCLLQRGADKVYAIDVGKGILHWKLRKDPRVVVMERTNARYVESLPEPVSLVTIDASFISLKILLPVVKGWSAPPADSLHNGAMEGEVIALIKPQFEAGRREVSRGKGVIRDPEIHRRVLLEILTFAQDNEFGVRGLVRSPVLGPKGNTEFLVWLGIGIPPADGEQLSAWVDAAAPSEHPGDGQ